MAVSQVRTGPGSQRNRRFLFFTGIALALLAFLLIFALGSVFASALRPSGSVQVVVATRDIQAREALTSDVLSTVGYKSQFVPTGSFSKVADLSGMSAVVTILKGQPITSNLVTNAPDLLVTGQQSFLPIPKGWVARSIPTNELQGVSGYVAAGDFVNVVATVDTSLFGDSSPKTVTKTIFENLHVIRVGPVSPGTSGRQGGTVQGVSSSLVVIVTECDAEVLDWLIAAGVHLTYVLLSYKDYASPPTAPNPTCPSSTSPDQGVGASQINSRFKFTSV